MPSKSRSEALDDATLDAAQGGGHVEVYEVKWGTRLGTKGKAQRAGAVEDIGLPAARDAAPKG